MTKKSARLGEKLVDWVSFALHFFVIDTFHMNHFVKGNFRGREQREPPPPGGTSAQRRVGRLRRFKTVSKRPPSVRADL